MKDTLDATTLTAFFRAMQQKNRDIRVENAPLLAREEYHLTIDAQGVTVQASCGEGIFRAATSLRQMIRRTGGELPFMQVKDKPDIACP